MVPENIRIKFSKTGRLKYISHLDLCRTMTPAMIRAKIPIWYTEGFNPHPKMVFTQPLPLFAESRCEYLDIKITEEISCEELKSRLRSVFTDELYVLDVYHPTEKFTEIAFAEYEITGLGEITPKKLEKAITGAIEIQKRTKSGAEKTIDISPQIKSAEVRDGKVFCVLDARADSYLNPDLFCKGLIARLSLDPETDFSVMRVGWQKPNGEQFV